MLGRLILSAAAAGVCGALVVALFQWLVTTPLILEAETYEAALAAPGVAADPGHGATEGHDHGAGGEAVAPDHGHAHDHGDGAGGWTRHLLTVAATVVVATGMMLIMLGLMLVARAAITPATALGWGLAGFVASALAPALGLPPELPGMAAADLTARQLWWAATVAATGFGLYAVFVRRSAVWMAAGLVAIVLPHIVGAPQAGTHASDVPANLAAEFVAASLTGSLLLWTICASLAGYLFARGRDGAHA